MCVAVLLEGKREEEKMGIRKQRKKRSEEGKKKGNMEGNNEEWEKEKGGMKRWMMSGKN